MMIRARMLALSGSSWSWTPQVRTMFRLPVSRVLPAPRNPTWLISGQSVWSGCGSELTWRARELRFVKTTRVPGVTTSSFGERTPLESTVIVGPALGELGVVGALPPPHAAMTINPATSAAGPLRPSTTMRALCRLCFPTRRRHVAVFPRATESRPRQALFAGAGTSIFSSRGMTFRMLEHG